MDSGSSDRSSENIADSVSYIESPIKKPLVTPVKPTPQSIRNKRESLSMAYGNNISPALIPTRENLAEVIRSQFEKPQVEVMTGHTQQIDTFMAGVMMSPRKDRRADGMIPKTGSAFNIKLGQIATSPNLNNLTSQQRVQFAGVPNELITPISISKLPSQLVKAAEQESETGSNNPQVRPLISFKPSKNSNSPLVDPRSHSTPQLERPRRSDGQKTVADIIDKAFGQEKLKSSSPILSRDIAPPVIFKLPEDKSAYYYDRLDARMDEFEDSDLFKYIYHCANEKEKKTLREKLEECKSHKDLKTQLLSKRPKMVFAALLKEFSESKILPSLQLKRENTGGPHLRASLTESKFMVGEKAAESNLLFDNLEETGATSIHNYIKNQMEQKDEPGSPQYHLMMMSNFLMKRDNSPQKNLGNSMHLYTSILPQSKQVKESHPKLSNLEHYLNRKRHQLRQLRSCFSYDLVQKKDTRNFNDICHIEQGKLTSSNFGKLVCKQYYKISTAPMDSFGGHSTRSYENASTENPAYFENMFGKNREVVGRIASSFKQKILVAKFSHDNYSLALGCLDGSVVIMQYNNEHTKWDIFQEKSVIFGRKPKKSNEYHSVVDMAWSMV